MSFFDPDVAEVELDGERRRGRERGERAGAAVVLLVLVVLLALVGGAWFLAWSAAGDNVPRGARVSGVAVGGRTPAQAATVLREALSSQSEAAIPVVVGDRRVRVDPARAGLSVDYAASIEAAGGGRTWDARRLWDYYTGGDDLDAVVEVDEGALDAALQRLAERVGRPAQDGAVRLTASGPRVVDPMVGATLESGATREVLLDSYLHPEVDADLTLVPISPDIDADDVARALRRFATPASSGAVTLRLGETRLRLDPADFLPLLVMRARAGRLVGDVETATLDRLVQDRMIEAGDAPRDAGLAVRDGRPEVVPARAGLRYPVARVAEALLRVVVRPAGHRHVAVRGRTRPAEVTTRDVQRLGVRELVAQASVALPPGGADAELARAVEVVDATLVEPRRAFSLRRTLAGTGVGAGAGDLAAALFAAAWSGGFADLEHRAHATYEARYRPGLEATYVPGSTDLRWRDDTEHGVLVGVTTGADRLVVRLFSTRTRQVSVRTSPRHDPAVAPVRRGTGPECRPRPGSPGFTVDVTRRIAGLAGSGRTRTDRLSTTYQPVAALSCRMRSTAGRG